eukprot:COSAG02_NODE_8549_length_2527_cov_1.095513_2_plen_71_part_00
MWRLNHTLAAEGRECWARDYASEGDKNGLQRVGTDAEHAKTAESLWIDQLQVFERYGDALSIAPIDSTKE